LGDAFSRRGTAGQAVAGQRLSDLRLRMSGRKDRQGSLRTRR
jgi:hypothetical protein